MLSRPITGRRILNVLLAGFTLVILLLMAAAFVAVVNVQSIRASAGTLGRERLVANRLIDQIQGEQVVLGAIFHLLSNAPETVDRAGAIAELERAGRVVHQAVLSAAGDTDDALWKELAATVDRFSSEARRFLGVKADRLPSSLELVERHREVVSVMSKLIAAGQQRAVAAQDEIEHHSRGLATQSFALLGACLLLAILCAVLTVRTTASLFRGMEWQAGELSRVSWSMLDRQESAARRFSHELHDELGQSLTALKANLAAIPAAPGPTAERRKDCLELVNEAIANVRELSQLLRPTILDDFGLDAGVRWLAEGFTRRTGIQVDYESDFSGRLPDEIETHLFRIAQEALTNVARHAEARNVRVRLRRDGDSVRLDIADDGKGLRPDQNVVSAGLGLVGIRARARNAGGEVTIGNSQQGGLEILVVVPARGVLHEAQNTSLAG